VGIGAVSRLLDETNGREVRFIGDGLFLTFETASDAVLFGLRLATVSVDGVIRIWNAENGDIIRTFDTEDAKSDRVSLSPDGRRIISSV